MIFLRSIAIAKSIILIYNLKSQDLLQRSGSKDEYSNFIKKRDEREMEKESKIDK